MTGHSKHADDLASSTGLNAPSPIPTPSIAPTFAPGKKGPAGLAPRTNYSRVNTGEPPAADAGAAAQKSIAPRGAEMLPKLAGESHMGNIAGRVSVQDLVKSAMVASADRVQVTREANRQAENLGETKTASEKVIVTQEGMKLASAQTVEKLASALDFLADGLLKEGSMGGPYSLSDKTQAPPPGVSAATASTPLPDKKGQGVNVVPMHPGTQKGLPAEHGGTQMANNLNQAPGGREHMIQKNQGGKTASVISIIRSKLAGADAEKKETEGMAEAARGLNKAEKAHESEPENKNAAAEKCKDCHKEKEACMCGKTASENPLVDYMLGRTKQAEDAINPAQISAGAAVPPETSAAGQPGGKPAGGMPQGPTGLVGSTDAARHYTKGQAYANRKEDLAKYWKEPALSAQHDSVLQDAFKHTSQAGPKIASAEGESPAAASVKTAAARALFMNLAKSAEAEIAKTASADNTEKATLGLGV